MGFHGQFKKQIKSIALEQSGSWLYRGHLKKDAENFVMDSRITTSEPLTKKIACSVQTKDYHTKCKNIIQYDFDVQCKRKS